MKTTYALTLIASIIYLLSAQSMAAQAWMWTNPYIKLSVENNQTGLVGKNYRFNVYGAGGRPLYGAEITIYTGDREVYNGYTDVDGAMTFSPILPGHYTYAVLQGRYISIGGHFDISPASPQKTEDTPLISHHSKRPRRLL